MSNSHGELHPRELLDTVRTSLITSFTSCFASTADPYAVMRRMGHSSITVTYDTYGHMFPERDAEITVRLGDFFQQGVDFLWTRPDTSAGGDGQK